MTVVVVMGVSGARTSHGTSLQGEDGAVRRRRGAGLCRHLLIGGQLEGSQKTCDEKTYFRSNVQCATWLVKGTVHPQIICK